jgi:hypothetical protein
MHIGQARGKHVQVLFQLIVIAMLNILADAEVGHLPHASYRAPIPAVSNVPVLFPCGSDEPVPARFARIQQALVCQVPVFFLHVKIMKMQKDQSINNFNVVRDLYVFLGQGLHSSSSLEDE